MWGIFLLLQKFYCGNVRITKIQTTKQQQKQTKQCDS